MTQELLESPVSAVAAYHPFYAQLVELETNNTKLAFDYESPKGNKEARSHIFKLRQTKGALERTRKEAKVESLRIGRAIDSEATEIEKRIEAMIEVHQVKIDEIEKRESDRIAAIKVRLDAMSLVHHEKTASDYRYHLQTLDQVKIDDSWQEFTSDAAKAKDESIAKHRKLLVAREKADAEQAELERLRKEAAERAQRDRDEAIAKSAAEQAMQAAARKAEEEAAKSLQAIADAESKAKQEREAAERRELELKLAAENAERRRVEQEQKATQDAKNAAEAAERAKLAAIQQEKDRVAQEERQSAEEAARREANKAHAGKINRAAVAAMVTNGMAEDCAKQCVTLIAKGLVQNVSIKY